MIPFLDLQAQIAPIKDEIISEVTRVIESGQYILGEEVNNFEKQVASYLGVKHAFGVASGTDALILSLMAAGVSSGDEVITTPFTFFATAGAISRVGGVPVFVDIDEKTYNIDTGLIEEKITPRTKAILPVHLFGQSCDMDTINKIASKHNIVVIEDACQAMGATWKGKKVGSLGDFGCFSFFPTKNLGGMGDGGLVVTNNEMYASYLKKARVHGAERKYHHEFVGLNSRLDSLQAAILKVKLPHLDEWNKARKEIALKYNTALKEKYTTPFVIDGAEHIYHQYVLLARNEEERDLVVTKLKNAKIGTGIYYPVPLHLQESFTELGYKKGDFPVTEDVCKKIFSLPIYKMLNYKKIIYSL